ncbi:MAG: bifunctional adenosylcobinamide kinase/adenosylcobinamide-phosphate guanylyltransferase [Pseudomonadota bacterium]|nr:bifunctional adenosylcobinamide kinase/adenosylcobinamide-phosphate guanylyltransferase [Pseudomonadota bacterium]
MIRTTFILGGMRSGKSAYAERLAEQSGLRKLYVATAEALDAEMGDRIAAHRQRRGDAWQTIEEPIHIDTIIGQHGDACILIDCLTLWLSNLLHCGLDVAQHTNHLLTALTSARAQVILVSNETGFGVMPDNALARQFCDHAGVLHQRVAAAADRVVWIAAGIPTVIKG